MTSAAKFPMAADYVGRDGRICGSHAPESHIREHYLEANGGEQIPASDEMKKFAVEVWHPRQMAGPIGKSYR